MSKKSIKNQVVLLTELIINDDGLLLRRKREHKSGGQQSKVPDVRTRIAYYLTREIGISKAKIALELGAGISVIAMAIMREESRNRN